MGHIIVESPLQRIQEKWQYQAARVCTFPLVSTQHHTYNHYCQTLFMKIWVFSLAYLDALNSLT